MGVEYQGEVEMTMIDFVKSRELKYILLFSSVGNSANSRRSWYRQHPRILNTKLLHFLKLVNIFGKMGSPDWHCILKMWTN